MKNLSEFLYFYTFVLSQIYEDLRSLAIIRIGLALCVLGDTWIRLLYLHEHYSDDGVLPCHYAWGKKCHHCF